MENQIHQLQSQMAEQLNQIRQMISMMKNIQELVNSRAEAMGIEVTSPKSMTTPTTNPENTENPDVENPENPENTENPETENDNNITNIEADVEKEEEEGEIIDNVPLQTNNNNNTTISQQSSNGLHHNSINQIKQLHLLFLKKGVINSVVTIGNRLLQSSVKIGAMRGADKLFDEMPMRNCFTWNTLIKGYMNFGDRVKSLEYFGFGIWVVFDPGGGPFDISILESMIKHEVEIVGRSFVFGLKCFEGVSGFREGGGVHCLVWKLGFGGNVLVENGLVHFCVVGGLLIRARQVFDECSESVVTWTAVIGGYVPRGGVDDGLRLFGVMLCDDGSELDNAMMLDEDQSLLDAQTTFAVEALKVAVAYQGTGAQQKRIDALRQCPFGSPDAQLLEAAWCLTNIAVGLRHLKNTEVAGVVVYLSALSDTASSMMTKSNFMQLLVEILASSNSLHLKYPDFPVDA